MAVKIRLTRIGRHKDPIYRIVAADHKYARDGRYIEQVGYYDPSKGIENATLEEEKVLKWLSEGAQYSDTIKAILSAKGLIKKAKETKDEGEKKEKVVKTGSGKKVSKKKLESKKATAEAKKVKAENLKKVEEGKALDAKKKAEEEAALKAAEEAAAKEAEQATAASEEATPVAEETTTPNE